MGGSATQSLRKAMNRADHREYHDIAVSRANRLAWCHDGSGERARSQSLEVANDGGHKTARSHGVGSSAQYP